MRVLADAERDGFRVEGLFELTLETRNARPQDWERASRLGGSGGVNRPGFSGDSFS